MSITWAFALRKILDPALTLFPAVAHAVDLLWFGSKNISTKAGAKIDRGTAVFTE